MDRNETGQNEHNSRLACECGWLGTVLNDENPIVKYDSQLHHPYFEASGKRLIIYHCPICGGRLPVFDDLSQLPLAPLEERARIHELTANLNTIDDVIHALGAPDYAGSISDGISENSVRNIEYYKISRWFNLEFYIAESEITLRLLPKPMNRISTK